MLLLCVRTPKEPAIVREIPPLLTSCVASPFHFPLGRESLVAKHQSLRRNARGLFPGVCAWCCWCLRRGEKLIKISCVHDWLQAFAFVFDTFAWVFWLFFFFFKVETLNFCEHSPPHQWKDFSGENVQIDWLHVGVTAFLADLIRAVKGYLLPLHLTWFAALCYLFMLLFGQ